MGRTESRSVGGWMGRLRSRSSRKSGFSLAETTIILAAMSVMTATAAPSIMDYVAQARTIKASGDLQVLTTALARLLFDVGAFKPVTTSPGPSLLVGPGDPSAVEGQGAEDWTAPVDGTKVQYLVDHLVTNDIGYATGKGGAVARGWSGPYVDLVPADPWGHRYAANVGVLGSGTAAIVLCAGPNGKVETPFSTGAVRHSGDDVVGVLGGQH